VDKKIIQALVIGAVKMSANRVVPVVGCDFVEMTLEFLHEGSFCLSDILFVTPFTCNAVPGILNCCFDNLHLV
jgi:hypothetical protein